MRTDLRMGDCLPILKTIPDRSVDLVVTDPPYEFKSTGGGGTQGHKVASVMRECDDVNIINGFDMKVLDELYRVMRVPNIYIWCNARQIPMYFDFFLPKGCTFDVLVWIKDNPVPTYSNKYLTDKEYCLYFRKGGYCKPANIECARSWFMQPLNQKDKARYNHPTIKPLQIIRRLVANSSIEGGWYWTPLWEAGQREPPVRNSIGILSALKSMNNTSKRPQYGSMRKNNN